MVGCPFDGLGSFIDLNDYRRPASRLSKQCVVMAGTGVSSPDQSRPAHGVEKVAWKSALVGEVYSFPALRKGPAASSVGPATPPCACRTCHPSGSGGGFALTRDSAEMVTSADVEVGEPVRMAFFTVSRVDLSAWVWALVRSTKPRPARSHRSCSAWPSSCWALADLPPSGSAHRSTVVSVSTSMPGHLGPVPAVFTVEHRGGRGRVVLVLAKGPADRRANR